MDTQSNKIYEITIYENSKGQSIRKMIDISLDSSFKFVGRAVMQVQRQGPNGMGPPVPHPFDFDIEATTIEEAYEKYEERAKEEVSNINKQMSSKIVVPTTKKVNP